MCAFAYMHCCCWFACLSAWCRGDWSAQHSTLRQLAYRILLIHLPFLCIYKYNCRCQFIQPTTIASTIRENEKKTHKHTHQSHVLGTQTKCYTLKHTHASERARAIFNPFGVHFVTKISITLAKPIKLKVAKPMINLFYISALWTLERIFIFCCFARLSDFPNSAFSAEK